MAGSEKRRHAQRQWLRRRDKIAFVFSGGGPMGALQVGALLALFDHGVRPDIVVGTSAGALNATLLAFDPTPSGVRRLEAIWREIVADDLFPGGRLRASWTRMLRRGDRVFENTGIASLIDRELGPDVMFEDAVLPLGIVTTQLETGDEALFTRGRIREPLLASTAMPSLFPPVEIDGTLYIDGGVSNNVPIRPAVELGAKTLYVMNSTSPTSQNHPLLRPMDFLLHAFMLARSRRLDLDVERYASKVDLVMLPVVSLDVYVPFASMDFTDRLIEEAYEATSAFLDRGRPSSNPIAQAE